MTEAHITEALAQELDGITAELRPSLAAMDDPEIAQPALDEAVTLAADAVHQFVAAAEFCEMRGLTALSALLERNLRAMGSLTPSRRHDVLSVGGLEGWSDAFARYLRDTADTAPLFGLLERARQACWPEPLSADEAARLVDEIARECEDERSVRDGGVVAVGAEYPQAEDVGLGFAEDINPQLADTFLAEAPERLARLTETVQRLAEPGAAAEDLAQAQRLAHTIKGSANITGVRGLANLTHWIEAILERLIERRQMPPEPLRGLLLETADCLESMVECLAERVDAPESALLLLRRLVEWEHRLREGELGPSATRSPPSPDPLAAPLARGSEHDRGLAPEARPDRLPLTAPVEAVRVAVDVVDRLLTLASELATEIVQMRGHHSGAVRQTILQREHEQMLQTRLATLQDAVNVRGVPATRLPRADLAATPGFDPLELDVYSEVHSAVNAFAESLTDITEVNAGVAADLARIDRFLIKQEQISKELNDLVVAARTVSVQTIAARLARCVRQTCRSTGKKARLELEGEDLHVDSEILNRVVDPLMHMLRNAIAHGIEAPPERLARGKDQEGEVTLQFAREGESIVVRCHDDGAGYDIPRIRELAARRGLLDAGASLSDREVIELTLVPGFSTSATVTQVAGRGIGMDVVQKAVLDLRGTLEVDSTAGMGTTITLRVPLTLISMHVLLVRSLGQVFAVPSRLMRQALFAEAPQVRVDSGGRRVFDFEGDTFQITSLNALLGRPGQALAPVPGSMIPLLLVEGDHNPTAVHVDEAVDSRYLVVQRLGEFVPRVRAVVGASILQDGSVAPVLDLAELIRRPAHTGITEMVQLGESPVPIDAPSVLIVDDSLSARRSLSEILGDAGYSVRTAVDGLDAIESIERELPAAVVLDLEMPNMNGLELTTHLRAQESTRSLPLILVTSRSTTKHHDQARTAGVDAVVTKPWRDEELLGLLQDLVTSHAVG